MLDIHDEDLLRKSSIKHMDNETSDSFCIDNILDEDENVYEVVLKCVNRNEYDQGLSECFDLKTKWLQLVNTISGSISCIFLVVTFVVYILVSDLNNIHGKIVLSNVISMFFLTIFLIIIYNHSLDLQMAACKSFGYGSYFFTMSMFLWMSIMSFDLCWAFIRFRIPRRGSANTKFIVYSSVAWGLSSILTLGLFLIDQQPNNANSSLPRPDVGKLKCFLDDSVHGIYLHLPILTILVVNAALFLVTVSSIYR